MFKVSGNCEMCQSRIEKAAKGVKGVISAKWDVEAKVIHLDFDSKATSKSKISKAIANVGHDTELRSEEHTSELQSLMRISYADFCLKKKKKTTTEPTQYLNTD